MKSLDRKHEWQVRCAAILVPVAVNNVVPYIRQAAFPISFPIRKNLTAAAIIIVISMLLEIATMAAAGYLVAKHTSRGLKDSFFVGMAIGLLEPAVYFIHNIAAYGTETALKGHAAQMLTLVFVTSLFWSTVYAMIGGLIARPWNKTQQV